MSFEIVARNIGWHDACPASIQCNAQLGRRTTRNHKGWSLFHVRPTDNEAIKLTLDITLERTCRGWVQTASHVALATFVAPRTACNRLASTVVLLSAADA